MSGSASFRIITPAQVAAVLGVRVADPEVDLDRLTDVAVFLLAVESKYRPIVMKYVTDLVRAAQPAAPEHRAAAMDALAQDTRVVATETLCLDEVRVATDAGGIRHEGHVLSLTQFKNAAGEIVGCFVAIRLDAGPIVHRRKGEFRELGQ